MKSGSSQRKFQSARISFSTYNLNSRKSSPIYGASAFRVFVLLFLFSISSWSLKVENENNSMQTYMQKFDHSSLIYGFTGSQE